MRVGFSNYYRSLDPITFFSAEAPIGDGLLRPFLVLAELGKTRGVEFSILNEQTDLATLDALLFSDFPDIQLPWIRAALASTLPKYLITWECPIIRLENWEKTNHALFDRVFTWDSRLAESEDPKYLKINFSQNLAGVPPGAQLPTPPRLCALVASNKRASHPMELYSERWQAVEWFARNHPSDLDLFGPGWAVEPTLPVYRGVIRPGFKRAVLSRYRFSICYENAWGFPGYVTEKIFDSMVAGCVPIYHGAPDIANFVPPECYIDQLDFEGRDLGYPALYDFISTMTEEKRMTYVDAARRFLASPRARPFTYEFFAETILRELARGGEKP